MERTFNELEMSNFFDELISDRAQNFGQHHNILGGVIRWVFREIQSLELRNVTTTPFTERTSNELEMSNIFDQLISDRALNLGNTIILWEESLG